MKTLEIKIVGVAPLLMHNGRLADPLNEWTQKLKELSGKRNKTEADHRAMMRVEWEGSSYWNATHGLYIPGMAIEGMLQQAAKSFKAGAAFKAGVFAEDAPLSDQPRGSFDDWWAMTGKYADTRGVKLNGKVRIMRTRFSVPVPWSTTLNISFNESCVNERDVVRATEKAGDNGVLDYRPRFGRFEIDG